MDRKLMPRASQVSPIQKYEAAVDEYKSVLKDKVHPKNRTAAYDENLKSVLNRLMDAADTLDNENPGAGVFGLIILALRTSMALKDKNIELEVRVRDLERSIKRMEKK